LQTQSPWLQAPCSPLLSTALRRTKVTASHLFCSIFLQKLQPLVNFRFLPLKMTIFAPPSSRRLQTCKLFGILCCFCCKVSWTVSHSWQSDLLPVLLQFFKELPMQPSNLVVTSRSTGVVRAPLSEVIILSCVFWSTLHCVAPGSPLDFPRFN
jgi:hypothetical protein